MGIWEALFPPVVRGSNPGSHIATHKKLEESGWLVSSLTGSSLNARSRAQIFLSFFSFYG